MNYSGLLVGLGNPGARYERTRHNCGFALVSALLELAEQSCVVQQVNGAKFSCELWRVSMPQVRGTWLAARPLTFMNLSGRCVQPLLAWHKMQPEQLVVVHDELDLPPGKLRFKLGGGNAGHNGLKSIAELLGTSNFYRLRIGIGHPQHKDDVPAWVLGHLDAEDRARLQDAVSNALLTFITFANNGLEDAAKFARSIGK
ncbi:MAG: aminoacyl-tRNA hydrolase [Desulfovibrio sp.]|nr:aminoacyl-tRNA hydrolase [Desulfovibrio sp.]